MIQEVIELMHLHGTLFLVTLVLLMLRHLRNACGSNAAVQPPETAWAMQGQFQYAFFRFAKVGEEPVQRSKKEARARSPCSEPRQLRPRSGRPPQLPPLPPNLSLRSAAPKKDFKTMYDSRCKWAVGHTHEAIMVGLSTRALVRDSWQSWVISYSRVIHNLTT